MIMRIPYAQIADRPKAHSKEDDIVVAKPYIRLQGTPPGAEDLKYLLNDVVGHARQIQSVTERLILQ